MFHDYFIYLNLTHMPSAAEMLKQPVPNACAELDSVCLGKFSMPPHPTLGS